jgi:hypothetical protein
MGSEMMSNSKKRAAISGSCLELRRQARAAAFLACAVLLLAAPLASAEVQVFLDPPKGAVEVTLPPELPAKRFRTVSFHPVLGSTMHLVVGDTLTLPLFDDAVYEARIDRLAENLDGTVTVRARFPEFPAGFAIITTAEGRSVATIEIPEKGQSFQGIYDPVSKSHVLLEVDTEKLEILPCGTTDAMAAPGPSDPVPAPKAGPNDPATIDVLILYTSAADSWMRGNPPGSINAYMAQIMETSQLVHDNSGTGVTLRLVHHARTTYRESGDADLDLDRLGDLSDGYLEEAHSLRNTYGADLVALLGVFDDTGGLGNYPNSATGTASRGFSLTNVRQRFTSYTLAHEFAHNMGCGHSRDQSTEPGPSPLFNYAAGWQWTGGGQNYCSAMTYTESRRITTPHFSNPSIFHLGAATGNASNDNARVIRGIKHYVAAYRQAQEGVLRVTIDPAEARAAGGQWRIPGLAWRSSGDSLRLPVGQYTIEFKDVPGWTKPASVEAAVTLNATTARSGIYVIIPIDPPRSLTYPENTHTGTFTVTWGGNLAPGQQFVLERSSNGGQTWLEVYRGNGQRLDEDLENGAYRYRVKIIAADGRQSVWHTRDADIRIARNAFDWVRFFPSGGAYLDLDTQSTPNFVSNRRYKLTPWSEIASESNLPTATNGGFAVDRFGDGYFGRARTGTGSTADNRFGVVKAGVVSSFQWLIQGSGSSQEAVRQVAVDDAGYVYLCGSTDTPGWTRGGYDETWENVDGFIVKLSPSGTMVWASYLGGSDRDYANALAIDSDGNVYVAGNTRSGGWISGGNQQSPLGADDAFLVKLSPDGQHLWSTYIGGSSADLGYAIAIDGSGRIIVGGETRSQGWASGGFDTTVDGGDGFIAIFLPDGSPVWSGYFGGAGDESITAVALDANNQIYAAGSSINSGSWLAGGFLIHPPSGENRRDVFVMKLSPAGQPTWSTFIGGNEHDACTGIELDALGAVYVAGTTGDYRWSTFAQRRFGEGETFLARISQAPKPPAGVLSVTIAPANASALGARWRIRDTEEWHLSGVQLSNLPIGSYDVEFSDVTNWTKPSTRTLTISADRITTSIGTYQHSGLPDPTAQLTYPETSDGEHRVSWTAVTGAERYGLERSSDGGATWLPIFEGTTAGYDENDLDSGLYLYRVRAISARGTGAWRVGDHSCYVTNMSDDWLIWGLRNERPIGVVADSAGNAIAGFRASRSRCIKVSASGQVLWNREYPESWTAMTIDSTDALYVIGHTLHSNIEMRHSFVSKLDGNGDLLWSLPLDGEPLAIACDAADRIYVLGSGAMPEGLTTEEGEHFAMCINPEGAPQWGLYIDQEWWAGNQPSASGPREIAAVGDGHVVVGGNGGGGRDAFLRLTATGEVLWRVPSTHAGHRAFALDSSGRIMAISNGRLFLFSSEGSQEWTQSPDSLDPWCVTDDLAGNILLAGKTLNTGANSFYIPASVQLWSKSGAFIARGGPFARSDARIIRFIATTRDGWCYALWDNADLVRFANPSGSVGAGTIDVTIEPWAALRDGAQWRRAGQTLWRNSGQPELRVPPGNYDIEFRPVQGWRAPANQPITLQAGMSASIEAEYTELVPPLAPAAIRYPATSDTGNYSVSWDAATGADAYTLARSRDGGQSWQEIYRGTATSYAERVEGGRLRYRVQSVNPSGASPWRTGEQDCVVNISRAPEAPANVTYPATSTTGRYSVRWNAVGGANNYELERTQDGGTTWGRVYRGSATGYSERVDDGAYRYRVRASNAFGESLWRTGSGVCQVTLDQEILLSPELVQSDSFGGSGADQAKDIVIDADGNRYLVGTTTSPGWTRNGHDTSYSGSGDAFLIKLDPDNQVLWSTYLGGSSHDTAESVAVDGAGNIFVAGFTYSTNWASGGFDTTQGGNMDGFLAKFTPSGALAWSTYIGADNVDAAHHVVLDADGNTYVTGITQSAGWTSLGHDTTHGGGNDIFLVKVSASGEHLWSSYYGLAGFDYVNALALDPEGNIYLAGTTSSPGFAQGGFIETYQGGFDAFVMKLSSAGVPIWSTYLGGSWGDQATSIAVDKDGSPFITGTTSSAEWFQETLEATTPDVFVTRLTSTGALMWLMRLGGDQNEATPAITLDPVGNLLVAGTTWSEGWAVGGFNTTYNGAADIFVAMLSPTGQRRWSTYAGGPGDDKANGIAVAPDGQALVCGSSTTDDLITGGANVLKQVAEESVLLLQLGDSGLVQTGALKVTLGPAAAVAAGAQWRVAGGPWQNSGATVPGLTIDTHTVSFRPVTGWVAPADRQVTIRPNATTAETAQYQATVTNGALKVTLSPAAAVTAGAQWRVDGGAWQNSGATVSALSAGAHELSFKAVTGWQTPATRSVTITAGQTLQQAVAYTATSPTTGALQVTLSPAAAVTAGAQWRVDGGAWQNSGATVSGLSAGAHELSFKAITGWQTPATRSVTITAGQTLQQAVTYTATSPTTGALQVTLSPAAAVTAGAQWRVDGGAWQNSGATVSGLSAGAHELSFKAVTGWQTPSTRSVTITAGQTFQQAVAYTAVTSGTGSVRVNLSPAAAVTTGAQWRVDGGAWQNSGATVSGLSTGQHTLSFRSISGWQTPANRSVTIQNGLVTVVEQAYTAETGATGDAQVFISPEAAVSAGAQWRLTNSITTTIWYNSGITVLGVPLGFWTIQYKPVSGWNTPPDELLTIGNMVVNMAWGDYTAQTGGLTVSIEPADARTAGAQWRLGSGNWRSHGETQSGLTPGSYTLEFRSIAGWQSPAPRSVQISAGSTRSESGRYTALTPDPDPQPGGGCSGAKNLLAPKIREMALPLSLAMDPLAAVAPGEIVAIRLVAHEEIDLESISVEALGDGPDIGEAEYTPVSASDLWVLVQIPDIAVPGTRITIAVSAATVGGAPLEALHEYLITQPQAAAATIQLREDAAAPTLPRFLAEAITPVYRVEPAAVYQEPRVIHLPLPEGVQHNRVRAYYYCAMPGLEGWYDAEQVEGLLAESARIIEEDGSRYLELRLNHSGVLQAGIDVPHDAGIIPSTCNNLGGILVYLLLLAAIASMYTRRPQARLDK